MYLDDCVCVLPDLTWLPLLGVGRRPWYIIIIFDRYSIIQCEYVLIVVTVHADITYSKVTAHADIWSRVVAQTIWENFRFNQPFLFCYWFPQLPMPWGARNGLTGDPSTDGQSQQQLRRMSIPTMRCNCLVKHIQWSFISQVDDVFYLNYRRGAGQCPALSSVIAVSKIHTQSMELNRSNKGSSYVLNRARCGYSYCTFQ